MIIITRYSPSLIIEHEGEYYIGHLQMSEKREDYEVLQALRQKVAIETDNDVCYVHYIVDCENEYDIWVNNDAWMMHNLELLLCTSPQNSQSTKGHNKRKQICLRIPGNHLDSLRKQFGNFIISEEQSETSESSSLKWFSPFSDEESVREIKSSRNVISKPMSAATKSLLSAINLKSELRHLSSSDSENEKLMAQKTTRKSKVTKTVTKNSSQGITRKKTQIGSFVFSDSSSDGSFVEIRKGYLSSKMVSALSEDRAPVIKLNQENVCTTKKPDETHSPPISDIDKELSKQMPASVRTENNQHKASTASDLVLAEPITDASSWFYDSQNAKLPAPKKMIGLIKSVTRENNQHKASTASDLVLAEPITDASSWFYDSQNAKLPAPKKMIGLIKSVTRENNQHKASTASDLVLAEPITDASSWFYDSQNAKLPAPKKMIGLIKSVTRGHLELTIKKFVEWSFLLHNDYRHVFGSSWYNLGGYPFHIEINSNPMAGLPGKSNEYFTSFHRRFGILLVCDYAFPDPALRLVSNFVITLKAKNHKFQDYKINCSSVFSIYNKSGGTLVASSFIANPNNGLLHRDDILCIDIDVEFNASRELPQKPQPLASIIV